ncbi:hypothetical protein STCU_12090 [Strigomonas culicis]|uniref:Uncharacterized protein n=1 Tax=Strigomonas culicis TaxID=28005 RepID=S9TG74_9TRYP|nr:hypothetical protein STCU_12090 [Strigomonas culicis]|eukprot:EPY15353.1 hypothetical protein STCU_12090 [Strigomonas culicis]
MSAPVSPAGSSSGDGHAPFKAEPAGAAPALQRRQSLAADPSPLPFSLRVRCGVFGVVLLLSLFSAALCVPIISTRRYMVITQFIDTQSAVVVRPIVVLTATGAHRAHWCSAVTDALDDALDLATGSYSHSLCARAPAGVRTAVYAGVLCLALSLVRATLAGVQLGFLLRQWRRAKPGAAPGTEALREPRRISAPCPLLYADHAARRKALERERRAAAHDALPSVFEARVCRALSVAALVVSILCCSLTVASLTAGLWEESAVVAAVQAAQRQHLTLQRTNYTRALSSGVVWPTIPNLLLLLASTALLAVPSLSGIADTAAPPPPAPSHPERNASGEEEVTMGARTPTNTVPHL